MEGTKMIGTRGLLVAFAGAGLLLQGCSSPPPPPPAPVVQAPPPAPDFSGTYTGPVTFTRGCRGPKEATMTVENKSFTLPWNKLITFQGPVADDGSLSSMISSGESMHPVQRRTRSMPGGNLTGRIEGDTFTGQEQAGKCMTPLTLKKTG